MTLLEHKVPNCGCVRVVLDLDRPEGAEIIAADMPWARPASDEDEDE